ncbi:hypothetical protein HDV00_003433 [Rhizophlyctis rosea]|nr:hypothetical protein HDV00_003433 [Rhizophlyctis rosea]
MEDDDSTSSRPQGVGNIAKLFESRADSGPLLAPTAAGVAPYRNAKSEASSRRTSRTSFYESPANPVTLLGAGALGGGPRRPPSVVGAGLRERSISEGSVFESGENAQSRRISVARLSRMFEPGMVLHVPTGLPNQVGRGRGTGGLRPPSVSGIPKANSIGHLPTSPTRRAPPPKPVKPDALKSPQSSTPSTARNSFISSRPTSQYSTFSVNENPFLAEGEQYSTSGIEVPTHIAVSQRIASINASGDRTSIFPGDRSSIYTLKPVSPLAPRNDSPIPPSLQSLTSTQPSEFISPAPVTTKRVPPPVPPSPAARKAAAAAAAALANGHAVTNGAPSSDGMSSTANGLPGGISRSASSTSVVSSSVDGEEAKEAKREKKRENIMLEMVETERQFLNDMEVLMEVYAVPATTTGALSPQDIKILFGNLDGIIETSRKLLELLEASAGAGNANSWVGEAFNQMMQDIEVSYCEYCKHNEAAIMRLAELSSPECPPATQAFLKECQAQLRGKTGAWDLGSLVIKPVQRVLKYPLLIKSLLEVTPPTHSDFDQLTRSFEKIEAVAEKINEVKKRKDIVEKYVEGRNNANVIHGITKKWVRGTHQLKQATGLGDMEATSDALYDALVERMDLQFQSVQQLMKDLAFWVRSVKEYFNLQETIATSLEEIYAIPSDASPTQQDQIDLISEYRKACARISIGPWKDADSKIRTTINPALETLMNRFKEPQLIMRKRDKKLLDFDRAKGMKAKGELVEKALLESADAYTSINAQLVEELPKFLDLVSQYMDIVVRHIAEIQQGVFLDIETEMGGVAERVRGRSGEWREEGGGGEGGGIVEGYLGCLEEGGALEVLTRSIGIMEGWREFMWASGTNHAVPSGDSGRASRVLKRRSLQRNSSYMDDDIRRNVLMRKVSDTSATAFSRSGSVDGRRTPNLIDYEDETTTSTPPLSPQILSPDLLTPSPFFTSVSAPAHLGPSSSSPQFYGGRTVDLTAVAIYPFQAELEDEVDLEVGSVVRVERVGGRDEGDEGEWVWGVVEGGGAGEAGGRRGGGRGGGVPGSYVQFEEEGWEG